MKSKFINVLVFAAGAAIGSAVTWKVMQTKYNAIMQEEIDSIKEAFAGSQNDNHEVTEIDISEAEEESHRETVTRINWSKYEDLDEDDDEDDEDNDEDDDEEFDESTIAEYERLAGNYNNEEGGVETVAKEPYVIGPYDFGMLDDYHQIELTYYADGILEDAEGNIVTDADELIGPKALTTFGEYEEDAVHVRNEQLRTDFEILRDYSTYQKARSINPVQVDDE